MANASSGASYPIRGVQDDRSSAMNIDSEVHDAVKRYQKKMTRTNRKFLRERIADIEECYPNATERRKLDVMARFWFHDNSWPELGQRDNWNPGGELQKQKHLEEGVTKLEEVADLYHRHIDGLVSPSLQSQAVVDAVADALEEVAREKCEANGTSEGFDFSMPHDMKEFMKCADGVQDPDFQYEGMCGWSIMPDSARVDQTDIAAVKSEAKRCFGPQFPASEDFGGWFPFSHPEEELEMKLVIAGGEAWKSDHNVWCSWYIYCRFWDHDVYYEEGDGNGWAWRVVFWDHTEAASLDFDTPIFDTVVGLLEWYSSWYRGIDVDDIRREMLDGKDEIAELFGTSKGVYSDDDEEDEVYDHYDGLVQPETT